MDRMSKTGSEPLVATGCFAGRHSVRSVLDWFMKRSFSRLSAQDCCLLSHAFVGAIAVAVMPAFLILHNPLNFFQFVSLFWWGSPILISLLLLRFNCYGQVVALSTLNFVSAVIFYAFMQDSVVILSFPWLVLLVFSLIFFGNRSLALGTTVVACTGIFLLLFLRQYEPEWFTVLRDSEARLTALLPVFLSFLSFSGFIFGSLLSLTQEQAALRKSYRSIGQVVDDVPDLVTKHDIHGRVRYVSAAALRLFGLYPERLYQDGMMEYVHPEDRVRFLRAIGQAARSGNVGKVRYRLKCHAKDVHLVSVDSQANSCTFWVESLCRRSLDSERFEEGQSACDVVLTSRVLRDSHASSNSQYLYTACPDSREEEVLCRTQDIEENAESSRISEGQESRVSLFESELKKNRFSFRGTQMEETMLGDWDFLFAERKNSNSLPTESFALDQSILSSEKGDRDMKVEKQISGFG